MPIHLIVYFCWWLKFNQPDWYHDECHIIYMIHPPHQIHKYLNISNSMVQLPIQKIRVRWVLRWHGFSRKSATPLWTNQDTPPRTSRLPPSSPIHKNHGSRNQGRPWKTSICNQKRWALWKIWTLAQQEKTFKSFKEVELKEKKLPSKIASTQTPPKKNKPNKPTQSFFWGPKGKFLHYLQSFTWIASFANLWSHTKNQRVEP